MFSGPDSEISGGAGLEPVPSTRDEGRGINPTGSSRAIRLLFVNQPVIELSVFLSFEKVFSVQSVGLALIAFMEDKFPWPFATRISGLTSVVFNYSAIKVAGIANVELT